MAVPIDIAELKSRLNDRAQAVAEHLLPAGRRNGREWCVGSVYGEAGDSLSVCLAGPKAGTWSDFAAGDRNGGDLIDLWQAVQCVDLPTALDEIREYLGVDDDRRELSRRRDIPAPRPTKPQPSNDSWQPIWRETVEDGPHMAYLMGRLGRLPGDLADLRYHPNCPRGRDRLPAMVALMRDAVTNEPTGIHRTFIKPDGSGKADVQPNRMMLGRSAGAVIKLTPDEDVTLGLGLCEGIEDGIAILNSEWAPVWCCMSAGNVAAFPVLNGIEALTVFCDADSPGLKAAHAVVDRWREAGKEAAIAEPPAGVKDFGELGHA